MIPQPDSDVLKPQAERAKAPMASTPEKPPDRTDVILEKANWSEGLRAEVSELQQKAVEEVNAFGKAVANDPELGSLLPDQAALTERETGDAMGRADADIKPILQEAGEAPSAEVPSIAEAVPEKPAAPVESAAPAAEAPAPAVEAKPVETKPAEAVKIEAMPQTAEAKAQARIAEILQEMDGLRMKIKENPANKQELMQRRQALALEARKVQEEIKKLKEESFKTQNQAELAEAEADLTTMHAEGMADSASEVIQPQPIIEVGPSSEEQAEAVQLAGEAEEAFEVRKKQEDLLKRQQEGPKIPELANLEGLAEAASSAPEVGEADYKKFFEEYNGAEYNMALKQIDGVMGQRDAKIKELMASKPESEPHKKKIQEQIACLKLANQISNLRKEQWAKQNELFKAQKAIEIDDAGIAETQAELDEVIADLKGSPDDPERLKKKAQLEQQLENQVHEKTGREKWIEGMQTEIEGMGVEIKKGLTAQEGLQKDLKKPLEEEEITPRAAGAAGMLPEEMFEKGINRLAAGLTEWMTHDDIGEMAYGAVAKIFAALEWAVDKIPGGTKGGAEAAAKKKG